MNWKEGAKRSISKDVVAQSVPFTLDMYVEMKGGIINHKLQKAIKGGNDTQFAEDIIKTYS